MVIQNRSGAVAPFQALTNGGGTPAGTYTGPAFELPQADADEPIAVRVIVGALTGTGPGFKVSLQCLQIGQSSSGSKWSTVWTSQTFGTNGEGYSQILIPLGAKLRFLVVCNNADNAGTPVIEVYSRTKPVADTTP